VLRGSNKEDKAILPSRTTPHDINTVIT